MNTAELKHLLNHSNTITSIHTETLEKVLREYPYFQSVRCLHLKALQKEDNFKYNSALKLTAIHTTDRSVLHDFVNNESFGIDFSIIASKNKEITIEPETDAIPEPVSETIETLDNATVTEDENLANEDKIEQSVLSSIQLAEEKTPETQTPTITPEQTVAMDNPLEQSVLNSIIIANDKTPEIAEPISPPISLENPLAQSILSSIKEANETMEEKPKVISEFHKEKTSWLEDSVDSEETVVSIEIKKEEENNTQEVTSQPPTETISEEPIVTEETTEAITSDSTTTLSFQEWLQVAKIAPIERTEPASNNDEPIVTQEIETSEVEIETIAEVKSASEPAEVSNKEEVISEENTTATHTKMDLIDKFIETNPKIAPVKDHVPPPSYIAKKPDSPYLMTETLAKIYLEQKKYTKAIQAYEILILKYPEKSSLFADRILDIKELQQNNNR